MQVKTQQTKKFWLALILFGLMGQIAWVVENMYLNVFMYKMFHASADDISLMVGASAVAATLTTLFIGALADRIGKRKVFISAGYILWGISILAFALLREDTLSLIFPAAASISAIGVTLTVLLDCLMTFFGSSANDAAFNAWLTDSTDSSNRGAAEGINAMMPLVAILAVFGGFMAFDLNKSQSWTAIFIIIGAATIIIGTLGIFIIEEKGILRSESGYFKNLIYGFRPSTVKGNPEFYVYLVLFIIFNISIQIFMPYLIIYYEVSLKMTDYVLVMAPAIVLASVVTALWGRVYDKKGFSFSGAFSIIWLTVGYLILYFTRTKAPVFVGSLFMMSGYLAGMAVFGAKIRDLTPKGKSGMLQGVRIFSQVLVPGVVGPFIGRCVLANADKIINSDGTESFVPNADIFAAALVPIIILSIALVIFTKTRKPRLCELETPFEQKEKPRLCELETPFEQKEKPRLCELETPFEQKEKPRLCELENPFEQKENQGMTWDEYPRPQLRRDSYFSLCGEWELSAARGKELRALKAGQIEKKLGKITVPFPPESRSSGIKRTTKKHEILIYRKAFELPLEMLGKRIILHFGAVDQEAAVEINGVEIGSHIGGYLPFEFDITDVIKSGENLITVRVLDKLDRDLAYGKQRRDRGGMWYTPISGIWKQVWLEAVTENYIKSIKMTTSLDKIRLEIEGGEPEKTVKFKDGDEIREIKFCGSSVEIRPKSIRLWSPEDPYLYDFSLTDGIDTVESYFALRTISVVKQGKFSYIALNGRPYFCHGMLDQGYYPDGIYTPSSPDGLLFDIMKAKALGFNMLRKHIKIEHELFYYYCDKFGLLVFQDMVNSGKYSFLIDTALPTLGLKKGISHKANSRRRAAFERDCTETIKLLYNHPCVVYYTIFNEGWGQFDADKFHSQLSLLDPTRLYDSTSGWFFETESDIVSEHIYFRNLYDVRINLNPERPFCLSEFGGYSYKIYGHSFNLEKSYGYRTISDKIAYESAILSLYRDQVIPMIKSHGLCATVFTQLSDVEDEVNGFLTYDRQVVKIDEAVMRGLADELRAAFEAQGDERNAKCKMQNAKCKL